MATSSVSPRKIDALQRARRWGMGDTKTYMPYRSETKLFERMANDGLVRWLDADLSQYIYAGYAITEAGQKALDSVSQSS